MRQQISFLTQSRFYSPAFNAAIFDGPIRIYFAQYQESLALKIYFKLQEKFKDYYSEARDAFRNTGINVFIMLYPSAEAFNLSFSESLNDEEVIVERLGADFVVGVRGPFLDDELKQICHRMQEITNVVISASRSNTVLAADTLHAE